MAKKRELYSRGELYSSRVIRNKIEIKAIETADSPPRHNVLIPSAFKAVQKVEVRRKCNRNGIQRIRCDKKTRHRSYFVPSFSLFEKLDEPARR